MNIVNRRAKIFSIAILLALGTMGLAVAPAQADGPFNFFTLTPCRVVDTRSPPGPQGGPALNANTTRNFPIVGLCGVPSNAAAVAMNVTVLHPTDFGDLRIWPAGQTIPLASVINWVAGDVAVANGAIIPLGNDGIGDHVSVQCDMPPGSTGHVDLIIDVTGYFAP
jgi:hypothetical protein